MDTKVILRQADAALERLRIRPTAGPYEKPAEIPKVMPDDFVHKYEVTSNSTELNNELNWGDTDWNKEREEIKLLISKSKTIKCN